MNTNILLLSTKDFKNNSSVDYNVEDATLTVSILDAQLIDIQDIIGSVLYDKIIYLVSTGQISGTTQETKDIKELLDNWIYPTHIKFALYRAIIPMRIAMRNKGVMQNSSDNSQPVDTEVFNSLKASIKNDTEYYSNKLKLYLKDFFVKYPTYDCNMDKSYYNKPNKMNSFNSGIYLGK